MPTMQLWPGGGSKLQNSAYDNSILKKTGKIDTEVSAGYLGERMGFVGGNELSFLNYAF